MKPYEIRVCSVINTSPYASTKLSINNYSWDQVLDKIKSALFGFDAHLVKPVELKLLLSFIRKI